MKLQQRWIARTVLLLAALGCGASVSASVDTTAKPGGVYPLKPGIYVARGTECAAPANAAIRQYDGRGISTTHTHTCRAKVLALKAGRATVDQSCVGTKMGAKRREVQRQLVTVHDALTFTQTVKGRSTTYRYCAPYQLPRAVRHSLH
ncbi:hypothetical protein [Telluria aromaticivorans]|uniref:Secreted protein n=1 Tax=Telluria aromaticivorans TaxID=2725995 RepID=A0A7Y2JV74_9BURK|nr:hypothetical protein [Telluria aromaticivorans]NNG21630.1 hypothetical protein [Telluria aromaticivorans]